MKHWIAFGWALGLASLQAPAQPTGCTDPLASNFDSSAKVGDGSCTYPNTFYALPHKTFLTDTLEELSGMAWWNGLLWGHNDSGHEPWLYAFDTLTGAIRHVVQLQGATNVDWEDLAQDSAYFYLGDFGNNANGNRTNLRIYRLPKDVIDFNSPITTVPSGIWQTIDFRYPDQEDFSPTGGNNTRWDCEAMICHRGRLHLFTKNWVGNHTVHYSLPILPGFYVAERHDSLDAGSFMITGADAGAFDELLLTAYTRTGACALFLIFGFDAGELFFETGNVRRILLPPAVTTGQLEAVCFVNGIRGFTGSERLRQNFISVRQQLRQFTTHPWIAAYYRQNRVQYAEPGMFRFNSETDAFEYFDGAQWQSME